MNFHNYFTPPLPNQLAVQRLAQEKEDQQRQEQANKWLRENFMRDGETGNVLIVLLTTDHP